jgi:Ni/Fe-hydrogenase subunit HybB-like protein
MFTIAVKRENLQLMRLSALYAVVGIVLNRVNVNLIAFNWNLPNHLQHIIPPWTEIIMIMAMITLHVIVFRWILNRFPVMRELPQYKGMH